MTVFRTSPIFVPVGNTGHSAPRPGVWSAVAAAHLRAIPGVVVARNNSKAWVPSTAAWSVGELLGALHVPYAVQLGDRLPRPYDEDAALKRVVTLSLQSEMVSSIWYDTPPTADQPVRILDFQRHALAFAVDRGSATLWQAAGAGKTVEAHIWATCAPGGVLVVTRAAARETHRREIVRLSTIIPFVCKPAGDVRKKDQFQSLADYLEWCRDNSVRPFVIVGWEALGADDGTLTAQLMAYAFTSIIFDEIHRGKQSRRKKWIPEEDGKLTGVELNNTSSIAYQLACKARRRLGTSASPIGHRLSDLWGQLTLIEPWSWGVTASKFLYRYCDGRDGEYGGVEAKGVSNVDELKARLAYTVHHTPKAVSHAQLPPLRRQVVYVPPSEQVGAFKWSKKTIQQAVLDAKTGSTIDKHRVQQIRLQEAASRKRRHEVKDVKAWLHEMPNAKILIFTGLVADVDELGRQLSKALKAAYSDGINVWTAHGKVSQDERIRIQDAYMDDPGPCVLVATYQSMGESLNLQDTDLCDVLMLPWTVDKVIQLEGRIHRIGMLRKPLIRYKIAEDTYDERIATILLSKLPAVQTYMGNDNQLEELNRLLSGVDFDLDELDDIYTLDEGGDE